MTNSDEAAAECLGCESREPTVGNCFASSYPPLSCWSKEQLDGVPAVFEEPSVDTNDVPSGLYLHVPFGAERCHYCYYRSCAQPTREETEYYTCMLSSELEAYGGSAAVANCPVDVVYFGGGTLSLLAAGHIQRRFDGVQECLSLDVARKVTLGSALVPKRTSNP